jgi:hypothetical protein
MLAEDEGAALADEAFERWLQRILADPPEGPRRILRRRSGFDAPQEQLRGAMYIPSANIVTFRGPGGAMCSTAMARSTC